MRRQLTPEEIERRYDLSVRQAAVTTAVHAMDYLRATMPRHSSDLVGSLELLRDAIKNAIDHRATGREFRTLRHTRLAKQDPQNHPRVEPQYRRCQWCGAINPEAGTPQCPHVI